MASYVDCYWYLEKEQGDAGYGYPKLNPDPSAHLIISSVDQMFQYDQHSSFQEVDGSHWIYPHRNTFTMDHSKPFRIVGIKFRVGALYSLKNPRVCARLDVVERVDVSKLIALPSFCGEALLEGAARHPQQVCDALDTVFTSWLSQCKEDRYSELVSHILPILEDTPVTHIGSFLHRSQRTIERSFLRVTGFTLKQCQSIVRLESMLGYLYKSNGGEIDWSDFAAKYNFSDQPHLIRYLKDSIGKTPGEYVRQRDLTIDVYGDFEFL